MTRLVDFAAISDGWHLVSHSIGPDDDICVLFSENSTRREDQWTWERSKVQHGGRYRFIHLNQSESSTHSRAIDLPLDSRKTRRVVSLSEDRWLVFFWGEIGISHAESGGLVIDSEGAIVTTYTVGCPFFAQATNDSLWLGYEGTDERIFGHTEWLEDADVRMLDRDGGLRFSFNDDVVPAQGIPKIDRLHGLNVISEREACITYESIAWSDGDWWIDRIARIEDGEFVEVWPWTVISDKAPASVRCPFAVDKERLLLEGQPRYSYRSPREHPHRDDDRLYLVSLNSPRSMEIFPVDEHGEWIGLFRTEGRGSKLYLETEHSLFVIDAAELPRW